MNQGVPHVKGEAMKARMILGATLATLATASLAAVEIQFSPAGKVQAYRKVLIAHTRVELDRDFLSPRSTLHGHLPRITNDDAGKVAREMGESFETALADAFRARGFEIAREPGPDVLALSPALKDLLVNAPEGTGSASAKVYVREAGQATMEVEGRDAAGSRVVFASEKRATGRITELSRATDVSNRFWFETMFRRWADELAAGVAQPR
jgi:hypothetical protein